MFLRRIFFLFVLSTLLFNLSAPAQHFGPGKRDGSLFYVAKMLKPIVTVSYEGSEKLKHQYAIYVEDQRLVYVMVTTYDTTYTIIPYEAIDFADTGKLPGRYLNLYTAFGAFIHYSKKTDKMNAVSYTRILMQDSAIFDTRRLMAAFNYLGLGKAADTMKQNFSNPAFFRLRPYQQFPRYRLTDSTGKQMLVTNIIKKAKKPAIVFTWADWCPPCIQLFDSLVQQNIHNDYSMVLIKKVPKENPGAKYFVPGNLRKGVTFLFDEQSVTDTLDMGSVPLVFFTDASGVIIREHNGYNISVESIQQILSAIKYRILVPGPRYYDFFDTPVISEADARFKYTIEKKGSIVRLNIYFRKLEQFALKGTLEYKMNAIGELQPVN